MIAIKDIDSGSPNGGQSNELGSVPGEVSFPHILSWIKQPDRPNCFWIYTGEIWPFVLVAPQTAPCQIFQHGGSTVLLGADMIELKPQLSETLGKMAVIATKRGALLDP